MKEYIRDLREGDLEYLAENLRDADKTEVLAHGGTVLEALDESVSLSTYCKVIHVDDTPIAVMGAAEYQTGKWTIWMLGTPGIEDIKITFLRYSKDVIRFLFEYTGADQFFNYTYAKNELHHKWLSWLGANIGTTPVLVGPNETPFYPFVIQKEIYV